jgi:hypothetical protein
MSRRRTASLIGCALVGGVALGSVGGGLVAGTSAAPVAVREAATSTPDFAPACPHFSYGADGTAGPIFCTIDNPAALHYYAAALEPLIALGPNATPGQVQSKLAWEMRHGGPDGDVLTGTLPIQCQLFQLAAHYWRWSFFYTPQYCSLPPNT